MRLWTAWLDYLATGEGRTYMASIAYAATADEARQEFEKRFGSYFAEGASVGEGVVRNRVTDLLFSNQVLDHMQGLEGGAALMLQGCYHFNRS